MIAGTTDLEADNSHSLDLLSLTLPSLDITLDQQFYRKNMYYLILILIYVNMFTITHQKREK